MARKKVLIVEDEAIVAEEMRLRLQSSGYDVTGIACSAEDALKQLEITRPDVVLLDVVLRGKLSGTDIYNGIEEKYGVPVVFITAHASVRESIKKDNQTSFVITKPFDENTLTQTIERALRTLRKAK